MFESQTYVFELGQQMQKIKKFKYVQKCCQLWLISLWLMYSYRLALLYITQLAEQN
jgi:hypothetical protein